MTIRTKAYHLYLGLVLAAIVGCSQTIPVETGFLERSIVVDGDSSTYQVYVPPDYTADKEWPVILFLHGAGERGEDGLIQTQVGLGSAIIKNLEKWPAIVVFPQVPEQLTWQAGPGAVAMAALDATVASYSTDASRVYLTGLSMGGNGTWYLGNKYPDRFAALVPICAYVTGFGQAWPSVIPDTEGDRYAELAQSVGELPIWIVHGDADTVVSVEESRKMVAALEAIGAEVHYTELAGIGHNAWDAAYANADLITWLFAQQRN